MFKVNDKDTRTSPLTVYEAAPITYTKCQIKLSKFSM